MNNVNVLGYLRVHIGLFSNSILFGCQQKAESVGEALIQFIYYDLTGLQNRASYKGEDFAGLHPYFRYCNREYLDQFIKSLNSHEADISFPSIDKLIELQQRYRNFLVDIYENASDFDARRLSKIIDSSDLIKDSTFYSLESLSTDEKGNSYIDFFVSCFEDVLCLELIETIRRKINFIECKNCGRLFIPKRANSDYCQRVYTADGKTCAEIGYARNFNKTVRNDELLMAYTKAYKAHYARMSKPRKRVRNMTREEFNMWYREAKDKLNQARAGLIDPDEYKAWLKI